MHRDPRILLADIDRAGADVERFTEGIDSNIYAEDAMAQAAVIPKRFKCVSR